jgi:hypothetical protein
MVEHYAPQIAQAIKDGYRQQELMAAIHREQDARKAPITDLNINFNITPLKTIVTKMYADGWTSGVKAASESSGINVVANDLASNYVAGVDWNNWQPGDIVAANVARDGGLAELMNQADASIGGIGPTTTNRIGNLIADALEAGNDPYSILGDINDLLNDPARAETIALTELARAQNAAQADQLQEMGFDTFDWQAYDGACFECIDQEVANPHNWNDQQPPAHPRCRCSITGHVNGSDFAT